MKDKLKVLIVTGIGFGSIFVGATEMLVASAVVIYAYYIIFEEEK